MSLGVFCPTCGASVLADSRFCVRCGARLPQSTVAEAAKSTSHQLSSLVLPRAATAATAELTPSLRLPSAPGRSLREIYFELGLKLAACGRAEEALTSLEQAQKEQGEDPQAADLLLALGLAAEKSGRGVQAVRYLLEASLADQAPRRSEAVKHVLRMLDAKAAVAHGRWLAGGWWPSYQPLATNSTDAVLGWLLIARTQLFLANFEEAIKLFGEAAATDAELTREEAGHMMAPENLPPALSDCSTDNAPEKADRALVIARIWRAIGDPDQALEGIDLSLETVTGDGYPDAPIRALRAELLLQLDRDDEAAQSLRRAGDCYLWRNEPNEAVPLLEQAIKLDPGNVDTYWSLADALNVASYGSDLAAEKRTELIQRASAVWQSGYALRRPGKEDAWAYATAAFAEVRAAETEAHPNREPALWKAVALIERALLLTPNNSLRWGNLYTFHRDLRNGRIALASALRRHRLDRNAQAPLEDAIIILANTGRWYRAVAMLALFERVTEKPTPWSAFVSARLHLYCGRDGEEALARIEESLQQEPENLSFLETRGMVLRYLGRYDESREIAETILRRFNLEDRDNLWYYAWAALECGEKERALQAYEARLRSAGDTYSREGCLRDLALARLANGDIPGAREAFFSGTRNAIDAEDRWLLVRAVRDLLQFAEFWGETAQIAPVLKEFLRRVEEVQPQAVAKSAREELEAALARAGESSWQMTGALAGLARLDREQRDFESAAKRYTELQERWPELFPEAVLGIEAALDGLQRATGLAEFWAMRDRISEPSPWQQRFLAAYLGSRFKLAADAAEVAGRLLRVKPIILEMDISLLPEGDSQQWPIIQTYLPAMRERIEGDTGVRIPGTLLRSNENAELGPNRFLIMLDETPIGSWQRVVQDGVYCLADPNLITSLGMSVIDSESDPLDGSRACWIEAEQVARARAAGIGVIEDHHEYIVRQLESVMRKHLAGFVGVDEVDVLLETWRERFGHAHRIDRLRDNDTELLRFTRLVRRLVREGVSIADGAAILDAVDRGESGDEDSALRQVRLRLRESLSSAPPSRRVHLASEIEDRFLEGLREVNGKTFLALPPADAQELLGEIRTLIAGRHEPVALVAKSARLRPYLRGLLELEFPDVAVLASEELVRVTLEETQTR